MERKTNALSVFAILILLFPSFSGAATNDEFIRGYVAAVLQREFKIKDYSLEVSDQTLKVTGGEWRNVDTEKVSAALLALQGVEKVEIVDAQGVVISSSTRQPQQEPAVALPKERSGEPEYELGFLPGGNLFDPLIADPRWPHFSMAYQNYLDDRELNNVAAVSFGETIALYRNRLSLGGLWEVGFQAGVFSIFDLDGPSFDLINTDFVGGITASYRIREFSTFFRIFHQSSHLGDEFLLRNPINRLNLSFEGADLKLSYRFFSWLRLYTGGTYLFDQDPSDLKPWVTQAGIELQSPWTFWADSTRLITAADLQYLQENDWSAQISVRSGLQFERPTNFMRKIQLLLEYYNGHSPNGQFYDRKIEYIGLGAHLHF
ncbi:MAG TPA: DUF1207 domain-containing protein [Candidatus Binatia bacterium]|nr:DUF1207 domain-containing protein [Candidatus Binatia bacterium]